MKTIAVIGCGGIANAAHLPALQNMNDVRIKYGCDIIKERAGSSKEKFPKIETVITDYHEALVDPEVEAVFVLTPNYTHYPITMDALRAKKHVFCEKPITVNYALSLQMAEEAKKQDKLLNIGVCNRYHKSVEKIKEWVDAGKFGKIYNVNCSFRDFRCIPGLGGPFTTKAQSGGGVLIDWGVHFLDLILYILGNPALKTASCNAYSEMAKDMKAYKYTGMWAENTADIENGTNDVDDFVTGYIRTAGPSITFTGAWAQNVGKTEMYVDFLGDKGGARLTYGGHFEFWNGATLESETPEYEIPSSHACEDRAFIDALTGKIKTRSYIDNVLDSAKLLDALYESSDKNREITF